jgi:hypothetical protein
MLVSDQVSSQELLDHTDILADQFGLIDLHVLTLFELVFLQNLFQLDPHLHSSDGVLPHSFDFKDC